MTSLPESDSQDSNRSECCNSKSTPKEGSGRASRPKTRRSFLIGGAVLILLALVLWRPVQQRCLAYFLLRSEAPTEEVLSGAVEQAADPRFLLMEFWRTERIPHRQFVINYLGRIATTKPELFRAMEPVLLEAVLDPDISTREAAFATLGRVKHPQSRTLALQQLSDADPAARLIGLQRLRSVASSNDVAIAMRLLEDPEPRVVVAAAQVLHNAIGQNFGIKSTDALPQFTGIDTNPPPAPDLPAIRQGVQRAREWWAGHQDEFPRILVKPPLTGRAIRLATADFSLEDAETKPVRLSQFRGKTVLLAFWSSGAPASLDGVPALKKLQQRNAGRMAVVGVCIPAAPSCADEHEGGHGGHEHAHHHPEDSAGGMPGMTGTEHMRCLVRDAVNRLNINFEMVADPKGVLVQRFSIEDLPAYVLIDSDGMVRRRFVGFRSESDLLAITSELLPEPTQTTLTRNLEMSR